MKQIKQLTFLVFLLVFATNVQAGKVKFSTATPRKTVQSHLHFLKKQSYDPFLAAYTLGGDKPLEEKKKLAKKLQLILTRHGINLSSIPNTKKLRDGSTVYTLFKDIPEIYLKRTDRQWLYSKETVEKIDELYTAMFGSKKKSESEKKLIKKVNESSGFKFSLATPYNTIVSHLMALTDSLYEPELAATCFNTGSDSIEYNIDLAIKLKQIYLGAGKTIIHIDEVQRDTNYIDSTTGKHIYIPYPPHPELFLEKVGERWLYSRTTCDLIQSVHEKLFQGEADNIFGFGKTFKKWAKGNHDTYFGLELWQVYMALTFIIAGIALLIIISIALKKIFKTQKDKTFVKPLSRIIRLSILLFYFYQIKKYIPSFDFPIVYSLVLTKIVALGIVLFYTLGGIHLTTLWVIFSTRKHRQNNVYGIIVFVSYIIKTIIIVIGLLYMIKVMEFNLVNFLAGLSIGGFAFALGAQDTIKNFFGSLMIFADKSFNVGDWIVTDEVSGTVEEIGLRSTKIRTFHNSLVTVPNNKLSDDNVDNLGRRQYRRFKTHLLINYNTPVDNIEDFVNDVKQLIGQMPTTRKDFYFVNLDDFSAYGIKVQIYLFFHVPDWSTEIQEKHKIIKEILQIAQKHKITFAVPPVIKEE